MGGALVITRKDLKLLVRDRRALVLLILLPMGFISILGMAMGQLFTGGDKPEKYKIGFVDHDNSELSSKLLKQYQDHQELDIIPYNSDTTANLAMRKFEIAALVTVGPTFEERVVDDLQIEELLGGDNADNAATLESVDVKMEVKSTVAEGDLMKYFLYTEMYRVILPVVAAKKPILRNYFKPKDDTEETPSETTAEIPIVAAAPPKQETSKIYTFLVPGFTVMFVFFLINIMARSFIAERDIGTLRRLRLAPIAPVSILIGKTLPFYICSVIQTSALFLSGRLLFNMPWGPEPVYLIPVILCTSAAATSLGLMLATWVKTDQQVSAYGTSMVLILGGISGCFIPRMWLPALMKKLSLATPHAWALQAFESVLTVDVIDVTVIITYCAALLGFAAAFFSVGWWRFRTEMG